MTLTSAQRPELEQAKFRVSIPALVLVIFAGYWLLGGDLSESQLHALWFVIGFFLFGIAMALHILAMPNVSIFRRYLGIFADIVGNTYFMLVAGEHGALIFFVYLFLTFGNRLRYGRPYMLVSQALSLLGLVMVFLFSDFWSHHVWVAGGVLVAMVVLPNYVDVLVRRIEGALQEAQQQVRELSRKLAQLTPPTA